MTLWLYFCLAFKYGHSKQNIYFLSVNCLFEAYWTPQHKQSIPLRTMCYIINKHWNTLEDCSKDSSVLTSMNSVLYSVCSYCIDNYVQSAVVRQGNNDHNVLYCFVHVCVCMWETLRRLFMFACLCLFERVTERWQCIFSSSLPSITNLQTFPFAQGCEWLKAWDISVILQNLETGQMSNVQH